MSTVSKLRWTRFKQRDLFTDGLCKENTNFYVLYTILWTIQWSICIVQAIRYYYDDELLKYDIDNWLWGFNKTLTCTAISISTNVILLSIFYNRLKLWYSSGRNQTSFLLIEMPIMVLAPLIVIKITNHLIPSIGICTNFFFGLEHVRVVLKMISLIVNLWIFGNWHKSDIPDVVVKFPTMKQYAYFIIAPTLTFRNEYPRTEKIRITYVVYYMAVWLVSLYNWYFFFTYHFTYRYHNFVCADLSLSLLPEWVAFMFLGHWFTYIFQSMYFHGFQTMAAELTTFGDREFYTDWWSSVKCAGVVRKWNTLTTNFINDCVHNPLCILLIDKYNMSVKNAHRIALYFTMLLSAMFHDYVLYSAFGFSLSLIQWLPFWGFANAFIIDLLDPLIVKLNSKYFKLGYFLLQIEMYVCILLYTHIYYSIKNSSSIK